MEIPQHYYLAKAFKIPAKPPHAFGTLMSPWEERTATNYANNLSCLITDSCS